MPGCVATLVGVVAIDTRGDGQTVGMVRSTGDGRYFMIWNVIVRPSHQGQKIGAAMVHWMGFASAVRHRDRSWGVSPSAQDFTRHWGFGRTLGENRVGAERRQEQGDHRERDRRRITASLATGTGLAVLIME